MPKIYNYRHEKICELYEATNINLLLQLGGINELSFIFPKHLIANNQVQFDSKGNPISNPKWDYIKNEYIIEFDNDYYIIKFPTDQRTEDGKLISNVQAKHMSIELTDNMVQYLDLTPPASTPVTADVAITSVLQAANSNWELGSVDSELLTISRTFKFEWQSALYCLNEVAKKFDGILTFDVSWDSVNSKWVRKVNLKKNFADNGFMFRYDKNVKSIKRQSDTSNIITRLYCLGKDKMSINNQPTEQRTDSGVTYDTHINGQSYIDNFQFYLAQGYTYQECLDNFIKVGRFQDEVYVNSADLYEDGKKELEKLSMPKVSYVMRVVDLSYIDDVNYSAFDIGEIVKVYDKDLNIDINAQIVRMNINYEQPHLTEIEIANYQENLEDVLKNVTVQTKSLYYDIGVKRDQKFANSVSINNDYGLTVVDDTGQVRVKTGQYEPGKYGQWMGDGTETVFEFNTSSNKLTLKADVVMTGGSISWDTVSPPTQRDLGIWTTYIDANGIYTGSISANQIITGTLSADFISGGTIDSSVINVDTDVTIGNNLYLGDQGDEAQKTIYYSSGVTIGTVQDWLGGYSDLRISAMNYWLIDGDVHVGNLYAKSSGINLYGTWNFGNATVTGLTVTAKFA